jgi:hypothetical protein
MRVNGKWMLCDDGVIRPVVPGFVRATGGQLVEVGFLLDGGADRTVFSARFLSRLQPLATLSSEQTLLSGIGGSAGSITVETVIGFRRDDQRVVTLRGRGMAS